MRRILFRWRGLTIYSYPAMLALGVALGVVGGAVVAMRHGLDPGRIAAAMLLLVPTALAGSRLLFVATRWEAYRRAPRRIWPRSDGGAALYGGLGLALLISPPLLRAVGLPLGAFWDVATITILI